VTSITLRPHPIAVPVMKGEQPNPESGVSSSASIDLYWLPLGAGGHFVRLNGRVYEAVAARLARRPLSDLSHSALEGRCRRARFVIEQTPRTNAGLLTPSGFVDLARDNDRARGAELPVPRGAVPAPASLLPGGGEPPDVGWIGRLGCPGPGRRPDARRPRGRLDRRGRVPRRDVLSSSAEAPAGAILVGGRLLPNPPNAVRAARKDQAFDELGHGRAGRPVR